MKVPEGRRLRAMSAGIPEMLKDTHPHQGKKIFGNPPWDHLVQFSEDQAKRPRYDKDRSGWRPGFNGNQSG